MLHNNERTATEEHPLVKTILVVEDEASIGALLIQIILQETSYDVLLVTDGFQALNVIREIMPNLFILDYRLPSMNGIDLYDQLHTVKGLEDTPGIMLSAYLPKHEIEKRSLVALSKPFELDELLDTVEKLLA